MPEFVSIETAVALVSHDCTLALGGMTVYRRPVGFVKTLLQRPDRPHDLTLLCFTAGFESDLLVGAGMVKTVRSVYFGLDSFGFAPMFTQAASHGELSIIEETEMSLAMGIRAQLSGVGFLPARAWLGTDLLRLRPDVKTIVDPYTNEELVAFPAVTCDIAVIHGLAADTAGNISVNNNLGIDLELVYLSPIVIATVEKIVDKLVQTDNTTLIPAPGIHYIVNLPNGAYPTSCYPLYPISGGEFLRYIDTCNAGGFENYLETFLKTP